MASDPPKRVQWAIDFWSEARFADPRDPDTYPDSTAYFGISGGEIVDGPEVQVAGGEVMVGEALEEVARIFGEHKTSVVHRSGPTGEGSKTVVLLPSYSALNEPGGVQEDDLRHGLQPVPNARIVVDLPDEFGDFVRIDAARPPAVDGRAHWEGIGALPAIRVAYTNLVVEADEESRLFLAGILISIAGGFAVAAVQMLFRS